MRNEAEAHAEEDKKRRESVEVKNMAETMVYTTEKMLKEHGEKANADDKKDTEEKLEALKKLKDSDDLEAIKKAADELATSAQKIGAAMYQQEQAAKEQAASTEGSAKAEEGAAGSESTENK